MNECIRFKTLEMKKKLFDNKLFTDKLLELDDRDLKLHLSDDESLDFYIKINKLEAVEVLEICESLNLSYCNSDTDKNSKNAKLISSNRRIIIEKGELIEGFVPESVLEKAKTETSRNYGSTIWSYFAELSNDYDVFIESF